MPAASRNPAGAAGPLVPGLPPMDAGVTSAFLVDDIVASTSGGILPVSGAPNGPPFNEVPGYAPDTLLVVLHGPVVIDGAEWYLLAPARFSMFDPIGWAPRTAPDGAALLQPADGACPASPMRVDELGPVPLANGLPACYGEAEVTIDGPLTCDSAPDPIVLGPPWLGGGTCVMGQGTLTVYGLDPEPPRRPLRRDGPLRRSGRAVSAAPHRLRTPRHLCSTRCSTAGAGSSHRRPCSQSDVEAGSVCIACVGGADAATGP